MSRHSNNNKKLKLNWQCGYT